MIDEPKTQRDCRCRCRPPVHSRLNQGSRHQECPSSFILQNLASRIQGQSDCHAISHIWRYSAGEKFKNYGGKFKFFREISVQLSFASRFVLLYTKMVWLSCNFAYLEVLCRRKIQNFWREIQIFWENSVQLSFASRFELQHKRMMWFLFNFAYNEVLCIIIFQKIWW